MLKLIYNIIIIPIIYFFLIIVAGFSKKIYRSLKVREKILKNLKKKKIRLNPYKRTVLFHCSSMGEYKQVLPIVNNLRQSSVDYNIVLSLFSPSVYENIDNENELFDIITYIPFDFFLQTRNFINIINPDLVIISKHDIWPNFIWELYKREIPTYLVNALFADDTKMDKWYIKFFFKSIFSNLTGIITINEKHRQRFLKIFPYPDKLFISGDSRFDTVIFEAETSNGIELLDRLESNEHVFVAGSTWPHAEKIIIKTWNMIKEKYNDAFLIIVPHEVDTEHIYNIESICQENNLKSIAFSELLNNDDILKYDCLIIDTVGILANVYRYGNVSYVGGGFSKNGLHSVIEPAVFGIPVLFGPNLDKSPEAQEMKYLDCGMDFSSSDELFRAIDVLWSDSDLYSKICSSSVGFINNHKGATERIVDIITGNISENQLEKVKSLTEEEFEQMESN
ncbi:MAG: hypothetical protein PF638_15620 [Candidatus Delongbacteria bacterium]|jgi:3-deoxy-D-manno-octulosonic-acid transferase|nr:hypothetical protein [Candidatus Delongbacteria bacterium]